MSWKWSKKQHEAQLAAVQQSKADKAKQIVQQFAEHGPESGGTMSLKELDAFVQQAMADAIEKAQATIFNPWPDPAFMYMDAGEFMYEKMAGAYKFFGQSKLGYQQFMASGLITAKWEGKSQLTAQTAPEYNDSQTLLRATVPGLASGVLTFCPACLPGTRCQCGCGLVLSERFESGIASMIIHLNDYHHWPRAASEAKPGQPNIADWLEEWALREGVDLTFKVPDTEEKAP